MQTNYTFRRYLSPRFRKAFNLTINEIYEETRSGVDFSPARFKLGFWLVPKKYPSILLCPPSLSPAFLSNTSFNCRRQGSNNLRKGVHPIGL